MKEKVLVSAPYQIFKIIKTSGLTFVLMLLSLNFVNAQNDNANENATVDGGTINTTDNTTVCVGDGVSDYINVTLEGASGRVKQWIITDDENNILDLPDNPPFDFDGAAPGNCRIWHLSYNGIKPLWHKHVKNLSDLLGRYDLSNYIEVTRIQQPKGGDLAIEGGATEIEICAGDGVSDAFNVTLEGAEGPNMIWVITDPDGNILGLPPGPPFDLEGAGEGTCLIWNLSYAENVSLDGVTNTNNLTGCFDLSNPITVTRNGVDGGVLEIAGGGAEIEICAGDGVSDAFDVSVTGVEVGPTAWVITDPEGKILGLPAGPPFDLEGAGTGTCLIWHLSYEEGLVGAAEGNNAMTDLVGCYDLSNPITVTRNGVNGGDLVIEGGATEIEICAGDGVSDAFDVSVTGVEVGPTAWVITDPDGNILGLPAGPPFDLEGAGEGTCLIWHLSYEEGLEGLVEGNNAMTDLLGCFDLSNPITVTRNGVDGGVLTRTDGLDEPFTFTVGDGVADNIPADAITLTENIGTNSKWVVTNADGTTILDLPENYIDVNFDGAGAGTCLIRNISYEDGLEGLVQQGLVADLVGCYSWSNSIEVVRTAPSGRFSLYPNPTEGTVNIDLSDFGSTNVNVRIFSLLNLQMFNRDLEYRSISRSRLTSINVSNFLEGIYFVSVTDNNSGDSLIKRLIVK